MKAEWRYEDVQQKLWSVENITEVWGIGRRTAIRLNRMGIFTMHDLAHANYYQLKQNFWCLRYSTICTQLGHRSIILRSEIQSKNLSR